MTDPSAPLLAFSAALGLSDGLWCEREELGQLRFPDSEIQRDLVASLQLNQITPLIDAYGDALSCRFLLGDAVALDIQPGITEADLDAFRQYTAQTPSVIFDTRLDKERLITRWFGADPSCRLVLYLFPEALERFIKGPLPQIEERWWGTEQARRVVVLVPRRELCLVGNSLAIIGGAKVTAWQAELPSALPDADRLREIYDRRSDVVRWQETWLRHLTPLHLCVRGQAAPNDTIASALRVHLVNLIVLYSADRTVHRRDQWVSTYAGVPERADVLLADATTTIMNASMAENLDELARFFDWIYDPNWLVDRLLLVQLTVAHALHEVAPEARYQRIVERAGVLYKDIQLQWKSFMARKLDAYTDQMRVLEDDVAGTAQLVADQVATMTKSLSDTMLAAVAALLASFIGAIFQSRFNSAVFELGMIVYATYVLCFPLIYNMLYQWQRYSTLMDDFAVRKQRFEDRLSKDQVNDIVGERVTSSRSRFHHWFTATVTIYVITVCLALIAAFAVPAWIGHTPLAKTPQLQATSTAVQATATTRSSTHGTPILSQLGATPNSLTKKPKTKP